MDDDKKAFREWLDSFEVFWRVGGSSCSSSEEEISFRLDVLGIKIPDESVFFDCITKFGKLVEDSFIELYVQDVMVSITTEFGYKFTSANRSVINWKSIMPLFAFLDSRCPKIANVLGFRVRRRLMNIRRFSSLSGFCSSNVFLEAVETFEKYCDEDYKKLFVKINREKID